MRASDRVVELTFNEAHVFYRNVYLPSVRAQDPLVRSSLELLLLAAGRAELGAPRADRAAIERFRVAWGRTLTAFADQ